jgi:preprotein translocase subunit YajC
MRWLNSFLGSVFTLLLKPLGDAGPWAALVLVSLLITVVVLFIFKFTSNQKRLKRKKDRAVAHLLELLIFRDDVVLTLSALKSVVLRSFCYLGELLIPMAVSLPLVILLLVHLAGWFDIRPLHGGEETVVSAQLAGNLAVMEQDVSIETSQNVSIKTRPVRIPSENRICWRAAAETKGTGWVDVIVNGRSYRKSVTSGPGFTGVSTARVSGGFWKQLANPAEPPLEDGAALKSIRVDYPERELTMGGRNINWILALFVLCMLLGLALMKPMRVVV